MTEKIDCIAIKREIQQKMRDEFEVNREDFQSFGDYIRWSAEQPSGDPNFDTWWEEVRKQSLNVVH